MDAGATARLELLRRDAELKLFEPLRRHGWSLSVEPGVVAGEYIKATASRGSRQHAFAILYTTAIDNAVFRRLGMEVELIVSNGDLYRIESYAHGVSTPIVPAKDFHPILVEWNRDSSEGKFAPPREDGTEPVPQPEAEKRRLLLSEEPIEAIWLRLRQLQSVRLAWKLLVGRQAPGLAAATGDELSTRAEGIAFSIRNATDYFSASQSRNVSQRILNLYYGSMAFAFAEMLATPGGPATLAEIEDSTKRGHGLYTVDGETAGFGAIGVGIIRSGFFPSWAASLGHDGATLPERKARDFTNMRTLPPDAWLTVESLFARIPEITDLFVDIFDGHPEWLSPAYDMHANRSGFELRNRASVTRSYGTFTDASGRMTKEHVADFPGPTSEIREVPSTGGMRSFAFAVDHAPGSDWWSALDIYSSPLGRTAVLKPIYHGVSDYRAICFVLLYALSIIVRYRPSVWRRVQEGDLDHLRALIEAFLAVVERVLPQHFLESVTGVRILAKQPGSLF